MKKAKKIIICLVYVLIFSVGSVNLYANADVGKLKQVVTEYNDLDLTEPLAEVSGNITNSDLMQLNAKSVILIEKTTGQVLYEKDSHSKLPPASITKVMSLLLVMEALDEEKISLDTVIRASDHACSMGGSQIWLEPNETMSVDELLKASVIGSANDATVALAEQISGSEEGFVAKMNERAISLNMNDTHFVNASGLDAEGHLTSANDIAIMSAQLLKYSLIKNYSTVWMDSLRNGKTELVNTNKLVRFYEGATGLKTGTTDLAGCCVTASAERDGMELIAVVMGAQTSTERFNIARKLLDYGFANYSIVNVEVPSENLHPIGVKKGVLPSVDITTEGTKNILIETSRRDEIKQEIIIEKSLSAPVAKEQQVGFSRILLDGEELSRIKILAKQEIKPMTLITAFKKLLYEILNFC
ncbi:MAG: D-alanyl-D-alanine carboxypeptidase family protein [bacterium]|nr:D-alanyl-D-alanine carboxypeptidase family protein [bacterium]